MQMQSVSPMTSGANEREQADSDAADPANITFFTNGFRLLQFDSCSDFLTVLHSDSPYDVKRAVLTLYYNLLEHLSLPDTRRKRTSKDSPHFPANAFHSESQTGDSANAFGVIENDSIDLLSPDDSDPFIRTWKVSSHRAHQGGDAVLPTTSGANPNANGHPLADSVNSNPLADVLSPGGAQGLGAARSKVPLCAACVRQLLFIVSTSTSQVSAMHTSDDGADATSTGAASDDSHSLRSHPHAKHRQPVGNPWLEVNKTIAFIFQLIVSRGFGKALADVLLHTDVRQGTAEEAYQLHSVFHCDCFESQAPSLPRASVSVSSSPVGSESPDNRKRLHEDSIEPSPLFAPPRGVIPHPRIASLRLVLTFLIVAHGDTEHVLPAAEVFQALTHIRPLAKFMYAYMVMREDGDKRVSPVGDAKSSEFYRTFPGQLCIYLSNPQLTSVGQAWKSFLCLLKSHRPYASVFLLHHMHCMISEVLVSAIDDKSFVLRYYGLSLLSTILQEDAFGAASMLYATSPALLCSVLLCSNGLTSQAISQKIFEVLAKMICAPELSVPVRYIFFINRDSILRMVDYISSLAYTQCAWDWRAFEQDRRKVLGRLSSLSPLSEEEMQAVLIE